MYFFYFLSYVYLPVEPCSVHSFNVYSFILGQPSIALQLEYHGLSREKMARWICNSVRGWVWAPRAVCLQIHLSNQILLHSLLFPHRPDILHSVWQQGAQDEVKGLRFNDALPQHSLNIPPSSAPVPRMLCPGLDHPCPLPHLNLKPFILLLCFRNFFFRQCNPESTLPCYSFVWTCEWWFVTKMLNM